MNTIEKAFEQGFIKAAVANGYTPIEAQELFKKAMVPPGNLNMAAMGPTGPMRVAPMQKLTQPMAPRPMMPPKPMGMAPKPMGQMPKGPLASNKPSNVI